ncbi:MAG: helix-turn-helix domain-containing protein, partial [Bacilli bacterium]
RINKKYTQEQMGEVLGVSSKYYGRIERGEYFLTPEKLLILHKELKVDLNYLLSGEIECKKTINELLSNCNEAFRDDAEAMLQHFLKIVNM